MGAPSENDIFLPIAACVRASGVSRTTLLRWLGDPAKGIREERNGTRRKVHLGDVLRVSGELDDDDDSDDDDAPIDVEAERNGASSKRTYGELSQALSLMTKFVSQLLEPHRRMGEAYSLENEKLRARNSELEKKLETQNDQYRALLDADYERQREIEREAREQKRLDDALGIVKEYAPAIVAGIAGHYGLVPAQEKVLTNMVVALSAEQFTALCQVGNLPPGVISALERIRATANRTPTTPPPGPNGAPTQTHN